MSNVLDRSAPSPDLTLPYGPRPEHVLDLRLPPHLPAYLIVLIHGGFWRPAFDRAHLGPMGHAGHVEIPGAGHFDLIDPQSSAWTQVLAVLGHRPS